MTIAAGEQPQTRLCDELDREQLVTMLRQMMLIRRFEERAAQGYQQAKIGGFCHLYIGQEATAVGSIAALREDDPVITAYRDHGHALARGLDPNRVMAELYGKIAGCSKGKGGSMHYFDKPHHMYGGHAIVGGQCPLGVGIAFGIQYEQKDGLCLCFLGDGALNQGAFHESMNLAAIWKLPILFVCENNMYSMGTHIGRGTAMADDLSVKAAAYGMRFDRCNGMDVLAVYECFRSQAERTRGGAGPAFIEAATYRYKGHSMSDPQKYRSRDEIEQYEQRDCIQAFAEDLVERQVLSQDEVDELDKQAKQVARDAVKFAAESPEPGLEELYTDVYSVPFEPYKLGRPPAIMGDDDEESETR